MSKYCNRIVISLFSFLLLIVTTAAAQDTFIETTDANGIPQLQRGWNLVSVPCTVNVADLRQSENEDFNVYTWNGSEYVETDVMERGTGYAINLRSLINISSSCNGSDANSNFTMSLSEGWNLIGNPYHKAVKASSFLDGVIENISAIYQYRGNKYMELDVDDNLPPWRGYWIYSDTATELIIQDQCLLQVKAYDADGIAIAEYNNQINIILGEQVKLEAVYSCTDIWGDTENEYVSQQAEWTFSDDSIGSFGDDFVFDSEITGNTSVTVSYNDMTSTPLELKVHTDIDCDYLEIVYQPVNDSETNKQYYNKYVEGGVQDDLKQYRQCVMQDCFSSYSNYDVFCSKVGGRNSYSTWDDASYWYEKGTEFEMKAICFKSEDKKYSYYGDGFVGEGTDVSQIVTWNIGDTSVIENIGGSKFKALESGNSMFSASFGDKDSANFVVSVDQVELKYIALDLSANDNLYSCNNTYLYNFAPCAEDVDYLLLEDSDLQMELNATYRVQRYSLTYTCPYSYSNSNSSGYTETVTEDASWSSTNEAVGQNQGDGKYYAVGPGVFGIAASYSGRDTDAVNISVVESDKPLFISLSPSNTIEVEPGATEDFTVTAYYAKSDTGCSSMGYYCDYEKVDISDDVTWTITGEIGQMSGSTLIASSLTGSGTLQANYNGIKSNTVSIDVKIHAWLMVTIASTSSDKKLDDCPTSYCYYSLKSDPTQFKVYGRDDNNTLGSATELTDRAKWEVSDTSKAVMTNNKLIVKDEGLIWIRAEVGDARSEKAWVVLFEDNDGFNFLMLGTDSYGYKPIKPLKVGSDQSFKAVYFTVKKPASQYNYYSYNQQYINSEMLIEAEYVTEKANWISSNSNIGYFISLKMNYYNQYYKPLRGASPGFVDIYATYNGVQSNTETIDVWNEENLSYCNSNDINIGIWDDVDTVATLETDCKVYDDDDTVHIRYTAEVEETWNWFLDNCLDLYVLDSDYNIIRTLREEGCTTEPLGRTSARNLETVYQTVYDWDMKDDSGDKVDLGRYYVAARFYILWEPVIRLPIDIVTK